MIAGDYIDSRKAGIRHNLPACGADVPHDELQLAALSNKLAGFDGCGNTSHLAALLPARPYNYNLPRSAAKEASPPKIEPCPAPSPLPTPNP
jgi:hypothetical protein